MATMRTHRGNQIAASTTQTGADSLTINSREIEVSYDEATGMYSSIYAYMPSAELDGLGEHIVDEQLSLVTPTLTGLEEEVRSD